MTHPHWWREACAHLSKDPDLARLIEGCKGERLASRGDAFATLLRSIIGQQISVRAAASVMQRLETRLGETNPQQLLAQNEEQLRGCGLSRSKVRYCRAVAEFCLDPPDWHATDPGELKKQLIAVPGIGEWTWEMFAIFYLQLPDEFPLRDLGLCKALTLACGLAHPDEIHTPTMQARIQSWRPWRTAATWHLWRSLDPLPVAY